MKRIKDLLAKYYARKSITKADKIWNRKKLSNEDMESWLNEQFKAFLKKPTRR